MTVNIEVTKQQHETNPAALRRFTQRVRNSKILTHVKKIRFFERAESDLKKKQRALKRITKQKERDRLKKLGKIQ
jgi:ribosomal protein S21